MSRPCDMRAFEAQFPDWTRAFSAWTEPPQPPPLPKPTPIDVAVGRLWLAYDCGALTWDEADTMGRIVRGGAPDTRTH